MDEFKAYFNYFDFSDIEMETLSQMKELITQNELVKKLKSNDNCQSSFKFI